MRLGVSNLAWAPEQAGEAMRRLAALGVAGVEVAPTRIAAWDRLRAAEVTAYRRMAEDAGLQVSSVQAVFYGRPELQLLGHAASFRAMAEHMRVAAAVAAGLGAGVAVFGAPQNRRRGEMGEGDAESLGAERLRVLGDIAADAGLVIGIEPAPPCYGADFLLHAASVRRLVAACGHRAVRTHLDTACVTLAGDRIEEEIAATGAGLAHFHIAEPELGGFGTPLPAHGLAALALRSSGYEGWVVIEMREQEAGLDAVETAVRFAREAYV